MLATDQPSVPASVTLPAAPWEGEAEFKVTVDIAEDFPGGARFPLLGCGGCD